MSRIVFDEARPVVESDPARTDVACFVGLARATGAALPTAIQSWLQVHGWTDGIASTLASSVGAADTQVVLTTPLGVGGVNLIFIDQEAMSVDATGSTGKTLTVARGAQGTAAVPHAIGAFVQGVVSPLSRPIGPPFSDIPIPIENYSSFTALFDPGGSPESFGTDYLAAAVRSFFAQGGRRCYIVRMDDPVSPSDLPVQNGLSGKTRKLAALLPGDLYAAEDPRSWHGVGHLGGLPDVSFLVLPDLPLLCASAAAAATGQIPVAPTSPAQFTECTPMGTLPVPVPLYPLPAPRLAPPDYANWAIAVSTILTYLRNSNIRDLQFVAAFPLPQDLDAAAAVENPSSDVLAQDIHDVIQSQMPENISGGANAQPPADPGLSTAFLQLSYPWLKTTGSSVLNESLEPPDGALAGILARNALTRGAFMDATKIVPAEISDVYPSLPAQDTQVPSTPLTWGDNSLKPLIIRLSLFGFTPSGLRLLSDVTAYPGEAYRPARVHRLVSVISRAAQQLGERITFQKNGPQLWERVETSLAQLLTQLWLSNALEGDNIQNAFSVRCDASTMTQNDVDNGRLIAQATFTAAATIELIRVTLGLETSGASAQGIAVMAGVG